MTVRDTSHNVASEEFSSIDAIDAKVYEQTNSPSSPSSNNGISQRKIIRNHQTQGSILSDGSDEHDETGPLGTNTDFDTANDNSNNKHEHGDLTVVNVNTNIRPMSILAGTDVTNKRTHRVIKWFDQENNGSSVNSL